MKPHPIIAFFVMTAVFFGSAVGGFLLANALAPQFPLSAWLGLCSLPLAFILGAHLWLGLALLKLIARFLRNPAQGRKNFQSNDAPPGSIAFVFAALSVSTLTGFLLALAPNRMGFLPTLFSFIVVGALYGILCHLLARRGYLPVYELFQED